EAIVVNIPEFRLTAQNGGYEPAFSMKVVVGGSDDHKTPTLRSRLSSVILRPQWDVPVSIQKEELLKHIEEDKDYLVENSYEVVDKRGRVVSDGKVDGRIKDGLAEGSLALRQKPGPENALGLIKFDFP